jgi:type I restriction enzyme S subunit
MAGRYKAYDKLSSTREVIIEDFPEHWTLTRIKFNSLVKARVGWHGLKSDDFTEVGPYLVTGSDFKGKFIQWKNCYHCDEERYEQDPYIQLTNGDLLITKDGTIGKVALVSQLDGKATLNSGVFVVRPLRSDYTTQYYYWLLLSRSFTDFVDYYKTGSTIAHLYQETFVNFKYPLPPYEEQQKIAKFLDHETAKIDTLIAKQEKLIELLKEKRQAVISHAVTKGLNPNAPMRDSGVEWLGEVPEHWSVIPNKRLFELTPKKSQIESRKKELCNFIPMDKLKQDYLALDEERLISTVFDGYTYFEDGDVLMAKVTPCFENKNMVVARGLKNGIGFGSSEIYVLRCNSKVSNDFIYYRLQEDTFMNIATAAMTGAGGLKRVPADMIMNFILALPPLEEQLKIVEALKEKLAVLDELSIKAFNAINLIKERKTALISAAVTGKIDVRHFVSGQGQPQGI